LNLSIEDRLKASRKYAYDKFEAIKYNAQHKNKVVKYNSIKLSAKVSAKLVPRLPG
jgi:hypothetical protein